MLEKVKGMFVSTLKVKAKHQETPYDVYFTALEEAYGNLPVPSDDYAGIRQLLKKDFSENLDHSEENASVLVDSHMGQFEDALEIIREHYFVVAKALGKEQKYG